MFTLLLANFFSSKWNGCYVPMCLQVLSFDKATVNVQYDLLRHIAAL